MGRTISVTLTDAQEEILKAFIDKQNEKLLAQQKEALSEEEFNEKTMGGKYPYLGSIGGSPIYKISYTSIGQCISVEWLGEWIDLTDYENW